MTSQAIPLSASAGYALWAETWDESGSPIVALEERLLGPWLNGLHPTYVVDVGCGTGRWTSRLGIAAIYGVDASTAMLAVASRKPGLQGRLIAGDAAALPIASGIADLVLCTLTLGHAANVDAVVGELSRILKPAGTLLLTDFHPAAAARGWRRTFRHEGRVYELENHPYTVVELQRAAAGLLVLDQSVDAAFGPPERELFVRAGRADLFEAAREIPAVLLTRWTRV